MEVKDIIDVNTVISSMQVSTKDEALRELTNKLSEQGYISDIDGFMKDIYAREDEGKTGIGNFIAIPHGKSVHVQNIGIAIGINDIEIPWESLDGRGVKGIILFAVGNDNDGAHKHLKLLSMFAKKLGNDEIVETLLQAKSSQDVINAFG